MHVHDFSIPILHSLYTQYNTKVCSTVSNNNSKHVELYALYSVSYSLRLLELSMLRRLTCTPSTLDSESTLREAWPPSGRN